MIITVISSVRICSTLSDFLASIQRHNYRVHVPRRPVKLNNNNNNFRAGLRALRSESRAPEMSCGIHDSVPFPANSTCTCPYTYTVLCAALALRVDSTISRSTHNVQMSKTVYIQSTTSTSLTYRIILGLLDGLTPARSDSDQLACTCACRFNPFVSLSYRGYPDLAPADLGDLLACLFSNVV